MGLSLRLLLPLLLFLSFLQLIIWVPFLLFLICKRIQRLHLFQVWSDIPGNPHVFDSAIISAFCTLPEPQNFNIVWTALPLDRPFLIRGTLPPSSSGVHSFTIYPSPGTSGLPCSLQLGRTTDKEHHSTGVKKKRPVFCVVAAKKTHRISADSILEHNDADICATLEIPEHWRLGFAAMRNFTVPDGTKVKTPEIFSVVGSRDFQFKLIRASTYLCAGNDGAKKVMRRTWIRKMLTSVVLSFATFWLFDQVFDYSLSITKYEFWAIFVTSGILASTLRHLFFVHGKKTLESMARQNCPRVNEFTEASATQASESSQPSRFHRYWMMRIKVLPGTALKVSTRLQHQGQQYWSLTLYDEFGLPLNDSQLHSHSSLASRLIDHQPGDASCSMTCSHNLEVLFSSDTKAVSAKVRNSTIDFPLPPPSHGGTHQCYALFRLVHPNDTSMTSSLTFHSEIVLTS